MTACRLFRPLVPSRVAIALLGLGIAATATAACPSPGTTYSDYSCATASSSNAPCYRTVISNVQHMKDQYGRYVMTLYRRQLYANGYYQWSLIADVNASCQR